MSWWDKLIGPSKINITDIVDIVYGGGTTAFDRISTELLRVLAKNRQMARHVFEHYDSRKNILLVNDGREIKLWEDTLYTEPDREAKQLSEHAKVFNW